MPSYKQYFQSKWLKPEDLQGRKVTVTIARIEEETFKNNGVVEAKLVLFFAGKQKGLILNKTKGVMMEKLYGEDYNGWINHRITMEPGWTTDRQGNQVGTIFFSPPQPSNECPPEQTRPAAQAPIEKQPYAQAIHPEPKDGPDYTPDYDMENDDIPF